jgi:hypothetical protein
VLHARVALLRFVHNTEHRGTDTVTDFRGRLSRQFEQPLLALSVSARAGQSNVLAVELHEFLRWSFLLASVDLVRKAGAARHGYQLTFVRDAGDQVARDWAPSPQCRYVVNES